ncbi:MAG TPA: hypothetical protein DHV48_03675 [Prolixibacteraceae bacterium]|nr:hypothetical protein [Prolixibacteraceae bacterium]
MKTPIIAGFSQAGLESYLNARQYEALYWPTLFPVKPVNSLDAKTIIGDMGNRVAAFVISYDAKAPEASRKAIRTQYFDIPKIALTRTKSEKEILEHAITRALRGNDAVLEDYFNDIDFVYDAAQARMEWLALQAISQAQITLSTANNPLGIINETAVDFGMPTANKQTVAVVWSTANAATMTPIADFKKVIKAARSKGIAFSKMLLHPDDFDLIIASTEFITYAKSLLVGQSAGLGVETLGVLNTVLRSLRLPEASLIDTSIDIENASGVRTAVNPFKAGHVVFVPTTTLGSMYSGPIAEEIEKPENVMQMKKGNVLISIQKEWNPVKVITKGESNSFPSWPTIDKCFNLYTGHTSTWAV